ncbi:MAG TPA: response regulator [Bacteroidales bacterium]|nr:response regulator [Bacteroidales bacterium]
MKIFILDDDEISNELSRLILNMSGVENVEYRRSGKEAIKHLDECMKFDDFPDLIFVDLNLPGMNGFEFIEFYEAHYRNYFPETGLILLTNSVMEDDKFNAKNYESVIDFWSKPLTSNNLEEIIERYKIRF